jgi:hypothetical protein
MHNTLLKRFLNSCSNNPSQSQTCTERGRSIQNLKWGGIVAIGVAFATCGAGLVNVVDKHQKERPDTNVTLALPLNLRAFFQRLA